MPQTLTTATSAGVLRDAAIGLYGKIPARGDFVRAGLPRSFTEPWDGWLQQMIAGSRSLLGEAWLPAWLEAPVWHFALSPGICGPDAVIGLWMPSVDSVGRYFPLTLAAVARDAGIRELMREGGGFLAAAELAGRDTLENDLTPEELAAGLAGAASAPLEPATPDPSLCPGDGGLWWTDGAPRVPERMFASVGLPDENASVGLLISCLLTAPASSDGRVR